MSGSGVRKRAVGLGPTGSVFSSMFLLSTNPVYAPLPVYWVSSKFFILSYNAWPLTESTGSETEMGANWFANS